MYNYIYTHFSYVRVRREWADRDEKRRRRRCYRLVTFFSSFLLVSQKMHKYDNSSQFFRTFCFTRNSYLNHIRFSFCVIFLVFSSRFASHVVPFSSSPLSPCSYLYVFLAMSKDVILRGWNNYHCKRIQRIQSQHIKGGSVKLPLSWLVSLLFSSLAHLLVSERNLSDSN